MPPRENLAVVGCAEHHEAAKEMADRFVTLVKDRCHYLPMTKERYRRLKLVYIGSEATVIAGQKFKSNDDEVIQDIVEPAGGPGLFGGRGGGTEKGKNGRVQAEMTPFFWC